MTENDEHAGGRVPPLNPRTEDERFIVGQARAINAAITTALETGDMDEVVRLGKYAAAEGDLPEDTVVAGILFRIAIMYTDQGKLDAAASTMNLIVAVCSEEAARTVADAALLMSGAGQGWLPADRYDHLQRVFVNLEPGGMMREHLDKIERRP